jgi:hypothetical protein
MKKIILGLCLLATIAIASSCGSHQATNAADGNSAMLDSNKQRQDSTSMKPDSITPKAIDSTNKPTDTIKKK